MKTSDITHHYHYLYYSVTYKHDLILIVISNYSCCHGYHTQVKGYMIVMSHDDIDDEDEHLLHTQLHHNCDMLLHMTGLETGYSKDIHGEVCMYVHNTMTLIVQV